MQEITAIGITKKSGHSCGAENLSTSESGLFLDELPGLGSDYFANEGDYGTCDNPKSYLSRLVRARQEAHSILLEDIYKGLSAEHRSQKYGYDWHIGQRSGVGLAQGNTLSIQTANFTDAELYITRLGLVSVGEGSTTVHLSTPDEPARTYAITVEQNGYNGIPVDIKLPLNGKEYRFEIEVSEGVRLQNNSIGCGCGAKDTELFKFARFGSSSANGLSLNAAIRCDTETVLSRLYVNGNNLHKVMARMLFYMAGVVLCDYILGEVEPKEHDTNIQYVAAKREQLLDEYKDRLLYLMETGIDVSGSACYVCEGPRRVTIG